MATPQQTTKPMDSAPAEPSLANEILAILLAATGILLALCLFTFNPQDPSIHTASGQTTQNFIGVIGANVAVVFFQAIGLAAFLLPFLILFAAWRAFRTERLTVSVVPAIGFVLLVISLAALLTLSGLSALYDGSVTPGGLTGALVTGFLTAGLGKVGSAVLLVAIALTAFLLLTGVSFAPVVAVFINAANAVKAKVGELKQRLLQWREDEQAAARARYEQRQASRSAASVKQSEAAAESSAEINSKTNATSLNGVLTRDDEQAEQSANESGEHSGTWHKFVGALTNLAGNIFPRWQNQSTGNAVDERLKIEPGKQILEESAIAAAQKTVKVRQRAAHPVGDGSPAKIGESHFVETTGTDQAAETSGGLDPDEDGLGAIPISPVLTEHTENVEFADAIDESLDSSNKPARPMRRAVAPGDYALPDTDFLNAAPPRIQHQDKELLEIATALTEKCREFRANGKVDNICPGPVVTTYEYKLDVGVKFNQVTKLVDDLCLGLKAESVRIDRIPGKAVVGIEIPNPRRETIFLREVIESQAFTKSTSPLTIALGKTVDGLNYVADLAKMPHLLIAGATGAGKSVGVNSLIVSILYKATPEQVKFIMVDPKQVELNLYADIPHLATPIITDPKRAAVALKWAVAEMERRYRELSGWHVRNIDGYNAEVRRRNEIGEYDENGEPHRTLPYIVIIIDELADLMMVARNEVEESITRLAQMARAVGIHLVLATQRPSVDVITGLIKANFPSRISFRVSSKIDSRTIIDGSGAEALLGRGDMLFLPPGSSRLTRVHGTFVDESEINQVVAFVKEQGGAPEYDQTITQNEEDVENADSQDIEQDEMFERALQVIVADQKGSTSLLQRRLKIGYGRAASILDAMERAGYVGKSEGKSLPRPVLDKAYERVSDWNEAERSLNA